MTDETAACCPRGGQAVDEELLQEARNLAALMEQRRLPFMEALSDITAASSRAQEASRLLAEMNEYIVALHRLFLDARE